MDPGRLRENFTAVAQHGDQVALFFFSDLFLRYPQTRDMFPVSMAAQRERFLRALGRIVADVDRVDRLTSFLQGLGRDHRKFGIAAEHYGPVGESLMATLAHFSGPDWTPELAAGWAGAYQLVSQIMIDAAAEDARQRPPFWDATVISHELRTFDISVLRVATREPLPYLPGQSVGIESSLRPRVWRFYAIANAPREDGTLDFHVQMVDGGALSATLVRGIAVGSRLRLGPPVGTFTLRQPVRRDVLLVGHGTGIAPLKAIAEEIGQLSAPPKVHMFAGARDGAELYELAELQKMGASAPWLTITGCASDDPGYSGERGTLPDVVSRSGTWSGHDAYIAGPPPVTEAMSARLASLGVPQDQISVEDFGMSIS
jgi:NAD(P)H-flavin reductase/hemoglobin-like flavoprotein